MNPSSTWPPLTSVPAMPREPVGRRMVERGRGGAIRHPAAAADAGVRRFRLRAAFHPPLPYLLLPLRADQPRCRARAGARRLPRRPGRVSPRGRERLAHPALSADPRRRHRMFVHPVRKATLAAGHGRVHRGGLGQPVLGAADHRSPGRHGPEILGRDSELCLPRILLLRDPGSPVQLCVRLGTVDPAGVRGGHAAGVCRRVGDVRLLVLSGRHRVRAGPRHRLVAGIRAAQGFLHAVDAEGGEELARRPERASRKRSAKAHPRPAEQPGCDHPDAGVAGGDPRQRDRQPHPPHPALCAGAGAATADPPALCRLPDRSADRHRCSRRRRCTTSARSASPTASC